MTRAGLSHSKHYLRSTAGILIALSIASGRLDPTQHRLQHAKPSRGARRRYRRAAAGLLVGAAMHARALRSPIPYAQAAAHRSGRRRAAPDQERTAGMLVAAALACQLATSDIAPRTARARPRTAAPGRQLRITACLLLALGGIAHAQLVTDLPPPPTTVRPGDLDSFLQLPGPQVPLTSFGWTLTPSLAITQEYQSLSVKGGGSNSQLSTAIAPSIAVAGQSRRITLDANYAPQLVIGETGGSQTYVAQLFSGAGQIMLVPDTLFVNASAFGFLRSATGTAAFNSTTANYGPQDYQTYIFSVSPTLQHRFGGTGTAELGYTASYSDYNSVVSATNNPLLGQAPLTTAGSSSLITQSEHASFTTGENFGRFNDSLQFTADQYSGAALYAGAHDETELTALAYAINRHFIVIGEIGHETIAYPAALPAINIDDVVWEMGGKMTLGPTSSITGLYGHRYGTSNVFVQGLAQPTGHLHLYLNVAESLTSDLQNLQNVAQSTAVSDTGQLTSSTTGAPQVLADNFFSPLSGVYRLTQGSITGVLGYDRDSYSASAVAQATKQIAQAPGVLASGSSRGYYLTLGWNHDFTDDVSGAASLTFGQSKVEGSTNGGYQDVYAAYLSLIYHINPTLQARAIYSYGRNPAGAGTAVSTQNLALITLSKQF